VLAKLRQVDQLNLDEIAERMAMATGHYGDLERWARHQAIEALQWKEPLLYFSPNHTQTAHSPNVPQKRAKIDK
jgi:hypothetical protein